MSDWIIEVDLGDGLFQEMRFHDAAAAMCWANMYYGLLKFELYKESA